MAQQPVFAVLERIGGIAADEAKYLWVVSDKLKSAKTQLLHMQAFLKDLDAKMLRGCAMARNLVLEVREVTYNVEDIIDDANIMTRTKTSISGAISKYVSFPVYLIHLHMLGARIDSATARIKTIFENFETHNIAATAIAQGPWVYSTEDEAIQHRRSVHPDFRDQVDVIGFDDIIEQIKDDLLDGRNMDLTVFSIVGPGGAGKSTMAMKVYGLGAVKGHFEVHAWTVVSQRFVPHDILKELVKCSMKLQRYEGLEMKTEHELKKMLHDSLLSKRYLIVLDDIWSTNVWDIIRAAFPDEKNGSRVILTTRNVDVAEHPSTRKQIYKPKLLNREESTRLLLGTALPKYMLDGSSDGHAAVRKDLDKLMELGKDIAVKCHGLPLALFVLGGYLSRNLDVVEWEKLTSSVIWHDMISTEKVIGAVLDLSYYDMPSNLRSCFMYTTAFPEDSYIDIRELTSLWIAEGFILLVKGKTREEVASKYIAELEQRCMIQVQDKHIKVHDIIRDWGIGRAEREGFMKDCHLAEDAKTDYSNEMLQAYRMAFHASKKEPDLIPTRQHRTLLCFSPVAQPYQHFRHLRVLYVVSSVVSSIRTMVSLPREIGRMRYLRYIGLGGFAMYELPSSIGDLLSLETFYAPTATIFNIPGSLWKIPTLRQVYIPTSKGWSVSRWISSQSTVHAVVGHLNFDRIKGIQTMEATKHLVSKNKNPSFSFCFSMTFVSGFAFEIEIAGRCQEVQSRDVLTDLMRNLPFDTSANVLKICCTNLLSNDQDILGLRQVTSFLRVLEIGEQSYTGPVMTFPSHSFCSLVWLVLHDLPVEDWKIRRGSMRFLRRLTLCKCPNLTRLPEGLLLLNKLTEVNLIAMPLACYQQGTVVQKLKKNGCVVSISSDEKNFQHLNVPLPREDLDDIELSDDCERVSTLFQTGIESVESDME